MRACGSEMASGEMPVPSNKSRVATPSSARESMIAVRPSMLCAGASMSAT
jgi:hypothetical protein